MIVDEKTGRLAAFKAYDIRGKVPSQLNEDMARAIGGAYAAVFAPKKVVIGRDMRLSSAHIAGALADGLCAAGVTVIDIGLGGTELVYFAAAHLEREGVDGGIAVTASHNPADYNGMKLVQRGAVPVSGDSGLFDIEARVRAATPPAVAARGAVQTADVWDAYVARCLSFAPSLRAAGAAPTSVVANAGNGTAGLAVDRIAAHLPGVQLTRLHFTPDGTFPHGVPNPMLEENRGVTSEAVRAAGAHVGLAWDGDHDRCFFFDERGAFVEGYYMVGLFAAEMLASAPGAAVIHDPRLSWNTIDVVRAAGGRPLVTKTGHAFIKERMRKENAIYGGEMSAHHYFRDFAYCDSGMIPWLLLLSTMRRTGKSLSALVAERQRAFPCSGEINLHPADPAAAIARFRARFADGAVSIDTIDGVSIEHATWRANVRSSNTEPVLRLNVESRGDVSLMERQTDAILQVLGA